MKKIIPFLICAALMGCGTQSRKEAIADSLAQIKEQKNDSIAALQKAKEDSLASLPPLPNDVEAQSTAENVIKAQAIDPDDVEFINGNSKMLPLKDSSWVFTGYVKIPNQYNMLVTMAYNVGIKWKGGDWKSDSSWTVKFCHITNPE